MYVQLQGESVPLPSLNVPLFKYVAPVEDNCGIDPPAQQLLAVKG